MRGFDNTFCVKIGVFICSLVVVDVFWIIFWFILFSYSEVLDILVGVFRVDFVYFWLEGGVETSRVVFDSGSWFCITGFGGVERVLVYICEYDFREYEGLG